jgi:L-ribulose-5-phosphate 4-epimerase
MTDAKLRRRVLDANKKLVEYGLVIFTWGNASAIDRKKGIVAIKPSGVDYGEMEASDIVLVDMNGHVVEGSKKPSVDLDTHLEIYKAFPSVGGVVHTHSTYATAFAQAGMTIKCMGTTHCDHFLGDIPVIRMPKKAELSEYEKNTGLIIAETFRKRGIDPSKMSACLIRGHGPFVWAADVMDAVKNSAVLEEIAYMNINAMAIRKSGSLLSRAANLCKRERVPGYILSKHFERKHGKNSYYGQK